MTAPLLHPDRLFPADPKIRSLARALYETVKDLPIVSPHGHTDPNWFSENKPFKDAVDLLITPDHYVLRMLYSQGLQLEKFGVGSSSGFDPRDAFRTFAEFFYLFRGTPSDLWLKHVFHEVFGIERPLTRETADEFFDSIDEKLGQADFKPRALFERFKIECLATTDGATDSLDDHKKIRETWKGRVIPTYRPDTTVDPDHEDFQTALDDLGKVTGEDTRTWRGYLKAHRNRREFFKTLGCTATDHGHPTPYTVDMTEAEAETLFTKITSRKFSEADAETFRAHMLLKMAEMSVDDGLVMQIHPGSFRNHNSGLMQRFGRDKGADIPVAAEYTKNLRALLNKVGNDPKVQILLYTLDETTYSRELAPLAGHYPALKLGAPWWFHDSPEGMIRHRRQTTETAGFYNTAGFVDDTRAFFSIPARHDVARRMDCRFLAELVSEHRLVEKEAFELAPALAVGLARKSYRL